MGACGCFALSGWGVVYLRAGGRDWESQMNALGVAEAALIGHSMGGMVAQELAQAYPDRAWALVLAETSYGVRSR